MKTKELRLILGDQLNPMHSWYDHVDEQVVYVIAELNQEATYTKHHIQKITAFFAAMSDFAKQLTQLGHDVCYLTLDETITYRDLPHLLTALVERYECRRVTFQQPDEYRLKIQLNNMDKDIDIPTLEVDSEHFLLPFEQLTQHFQPSTHIRMENFYRYMRKHFSILMNGTKPVGDAWNFDSNNRQSFKAADLKLIPKPLIFDNPANEYLQRIQKHNINTIGKSSDNIDYPINREQSLVLLRFFCEHQLPNFGNFQDAMTMASPYAWSLYHSRLSFSLNCKMITNVQTVIYLCLKLKVLFGKYWVGESM